MNWKLVLEYDGSAFAGWQVQRSGTRTVQETLLDAVARLNYNVRPPLTAAGRTDAGVHATHQVVSCRIDRSIEPDKLVLAINALLPEDVRVTNAYPAADGFDARRMARSRTYRYRVLARRAPSAVWRWYAYHVPQPLNVDAMQHACMQLVGTHDFGAFGTAQHPGGSTTRTLYRAELATHYDYETGPFLDFEVCGNAFLTHMVRRLAGTLLRVGLSTLAPADFEAILSSGDPKQGGPTLPAHGLYLVMVEYPPEIEDVAHPAPNG